MSAYAGRFAGRAAIITGGASGLGKEVARRIVAEGGKVALWDLNAEALERARSEVGASHVVALNVAELGEVEAAFAASKDALGQVDIWSARPGSRGRPRPSMNIRCRAG